MGIISIAAIVIGALITFGIYIFALYSRSTDDGPRKKLWAGTVISAAATILLLLMFAAVSSSIGISDVFIVIFLMAAVGLILSQTFISHHKNQHDERGKFNRSTGVTMGLLIFSVFMIGVSVDPGEVEEGVESREVVVEAGIDDEEVEVEAGFGEVDEAEVSVEAGIEEVEEDGEAGNEAGGVEPVQREALIPVQLYRVVDGDTVHVIDGNDDTLNLRLLLIDTPETVHPNEPLQPYGPEATERLTNLLNEAEQLFIEYDEGDKQDHYGRELVYLYADEVSVHEVLLKEGLARVGFIYEQQRYLDEFKAAEQYAKDEGLGIWSIPGYVNEDGEGFNYGEEQAAEEPESGEGESGAGTGAYDFANCTELREVFPDGVMSDHPAYQPMMDRDNDGHACE
ncbi:thermonuclease family protein [Lacicoccus alkaliphilus]|uniref:Endonuclease YncB, thermonuclease family n=1 Tax=Lacicoccus alkaliphilus DSM 16010 TaxID=1123231 RepID=A0A1M7ACN0_9BACL|nr:thermonuclease family protein [Salinicoccus alkaliphilus]SHL40450.1 Endonuclease YncB, thermonuclease family [Salinicoccus alkaliphilus DSM 16010]